MLRPILRHDRSSRYLLLRGSHCDGDAQKQLRDVQDAVPRGQQRILKQHLDGSEGGDGEARQG